MRGKIDLWNGRRFFIARWRCRPRKTSWTTPGGRAAAPWCLRHLVNALIDDPGVTLEQASERLLAHLGSQASPLAGNPRIDVGDDSDFIAVVSDALCMRSGLKLKNASPQARNMKRVSVAGIAESCLSMNGRGTSHLGHDGLIRAAHSPSDFPELLRNVAEKSLLVGYTEEASASHRAWTREGFLNDFKTAPIASPCPRRRGC